MAIQNNTQTLDEALHQIQQIFPEASPGEDNEGQLVIYTNVKVEDDELIPFVPE